MPRVHLKDNGDPAPCFAAPGECPKGENSPHFDTVEEALRHHARENDLLPTVRKPTTPAPCREQPRDAGAPGTPSHIFSRALSPTGEYRLLCARDDSRVAWDDEAGEYREAPSLPTEIPGYTFLSSGMERNVYFAPTGSTVYKLPNDYESYGEASYGKAQEIQAMARGEKQERAYNAVRESLEGSSSMRYAETSFHAMEDASGHRVPLIEQEYLSPEEYEEVDLSREELAALAKPHGMRDVHPDNVRRSRATGTLVFFDCL